MMQIIDTTDGKYRGLCFEFEDNIIVLAKDVSVRIDQVLQIDGNITRYVSTNYVIDAKEII